MAAAFIEHRPYSSSEHASTSHFVVIVNEYQVGGNFQAQVSFNYQIQFFTREYLSP